MEWWVEHQNLLPNGQYGFRKGRGTTDALIELVTDIQISLSENKYFLVVYTDLTKAYDCVLLPRLAQQLNLGMPNVFIHNLCYLLSNRALIIRRDDGYIGPRYTRKGLPQGSILSPLLFNLYTVDLHSLMPNSCKVIQMISAFILQAGISWNVNF